MGQITNNCVKSTILCRKLRLKLPQAIDPFLLPRIGCLYFKNGVKNAINIEAEIITSERFMNCIAELNCIRLKNTKNINNTAEVICAYKWARFACNL